jgi:hypothetical protein
MSTLAACSPEDYGHLSADGIPLAANYENNVGVAVDQSTNYATFSFTGAKSIYPVWIIDGKGYSTTQSFTKYYRKAGTYSVEVKFGNTNGISDGSLTKSFTVNKTIINGFAGFAFDSAYNLWTKATISKPTFWYAPGWSQIADPTYTQATDGYTITLPSATTDTWQAQMALSTNISTQSSSNYDFSVILTSTLAHPHVMVKLTDATNDNAFYFAKAVELTANEPVCFWKNNMKGLDITNLKLVLDFGGNSAGSVISVENIVLKNHANDDGTIVPAEEDNTDWSKVDSDDNLWKPVNGGAYTTFFYYAPNWTQIADPTLTNDNGIYTLTLPSATGSQWQAQYHQITTVPISASETYDFKCTIKPNVDLKGVTIKPTDTTSDDNYLFMEQTDLTAGADNIFKKSNVKCTIGNMGAIKLAFDFGGNPANTEVKISNIILQKHKEN